MKVTVIKEHHFYPLGDHEMNEARASYLISIGVAKAARKKKTDEETQSPEKVEHRPHKEKVEMKAGKKEKVENGKDMTMDSIKKVK